MFAGCPRPRLSDLLSTATDYGKWFCPGVMALNPIILVLVNFRLVISPPQRILWYQTRGCRVSMDCRLGIWLVYSSHSITLAREPGDELSSHRNEPRKQRNLKWEEVIGHSMRSVESERRYNMWKKHDSDIIISTWESQLYTFNQTLYSLPQLPAC
jgi:hypothetical protein